jgi:hypothetical protein
MLENAFEGGHNLLNLLFSFAVNPVVILGPLVRFLGL